MLSRVSRLKTREGMAKITPTHKDTKDTGLVVPTIFSCHSAVQPLQNRIDEYGLGQTQPRTSSRSDVMSSLGRLMQPRHMVGSH